ncbi:hypothetical protein DWW15_16440 [Subdoligranulum sp. AF14-43]|nr:hypothetical protein DWW15_16440 [Subdoligranulum sp. AF14-43]
MQNQDVIDGVPHSRPCFFAFPDARIPEIYWIVPISSKYEKYKRIEQDKIKKYGRCNTIRFGTVLGRSAAFLIQNMCPATEKHLTPYIDKNKQPIRIDGRVAADVEKNTRNVLALAKRGAKVIFPDVFMIFQCLDRQLQQAEAERSALPTELDKPSVLAQLHRPTGQTEHPAKHRTSPDKDMNER